MQLSSINLHNFSSSLFRSLETCPSRSCSLFKSVLINKIIICNFYYNFISDFQTTINSSPDAYPQPDPVKRSDVTSGQETTNNTAYPQPDPVTSGQETEVIGSGDCILEHKLVTGFVYYYEIRNAFILVDFINDNIKLKLLS